jgi:hypothetical protein
MYGPAFPNDNPSLVIAQERYYTSDKFTFRNLSAIGNTGRIETPEGDTGLSGGINFLKFGSRDGLVQNTFSRSFVWNFYAYADHSGNNVPHDFVGQASWGGALGGGSGGSNPITGYNPELYEYTGAYKTTLRNNIAENALFSHLGLYNGGHVIIDGGRFESSGGPSILAQKGHNYNTFAPKIEIINDAQIRSEITGEEAWFTMMGAMLGPIMGIPAGAPTPLTMLFDVLKSDMTPLIESMSNRTIRAPIRPGDPPTRFRFNFVSMILGQPSDAIFQNPARGTFEIDDAFFSMINLPASGVFGLGPEHGGLWNRNHVAVVVPLGDHSFFSVVLELYPKPPA